MNLRREYVEKSTTLTSDSQTVVVDLGKNGVISQTDLIFRATNGATSNKASPIQEVVSKVEVVADGSFIIKSFSPKEIQALVHFDSGNRPAENMDEQASAVQFAHLPIQFGRFKGDNQLGLNLANYTKVELKITYNLATINAVGATGFVSGTTTIDVINNKWPSGQAPAVRGYVRSRTIESFTTVASGDKKIELPLAYPMRRAMVRCFESGINDGVDITDVVMDVNDGEYYPIKGEWSDLQRTNVIQHAIDTRVKGTAFLSDTDVIETYTGTAKFVSLMAPYTGTIATTDVNQTRVNTIAGAVLTLQDLTVEASGTWAANAANTADHRIDWFADGVSVGNCVMIEPSPSDEVADFINLKSLSSADLILTQAAAGGATTILLEEIA